MHCYYKNLENIEKISTNLEAHESSINPHSP